jgi:hypothetical protein
MIFTSLMFVVASHRGFFFAGFEKLRITAPLRSKRLDDRQDRRRLALSLAACTAQFFCAGALKKNADNFSASNVTSSQTTEAIDTKDTRQKRGREGERNRN